MIRTQMEARGKGFISNHIPSVFYLSKEYVFKTSLQIPVDSAGEFR
jgi:hypothetical protein